MYCLKKVCMYKGVLQFCYCPVVAKAINHACLLQKQNWMTPLWGDYFLKHSAECMIFKFIYCTLSFGLFFTGLWTKNGGGRVRLYGKQHLDLQFRLHLNLCQLALVWIRQPKHSEMILKWFYKEINSPIPHKNIRHCLTINDVTELLELFFFFWRKVNNSIQFAGSWF